MFSGLVLVKLWTLNWTWFGVLSSHFVIQSFMHNDTFTFE